MTNEERVKALMHEIALASEREWGSGWHAQVKFIQRMLDQIKPLLQKPEPETLAGSVLRLTNICNELGRENALLRNDLTEADMRTKEFVAEITRQDKYIKQLKRDRQQLWNAVRR